MPDHATCERFIDPKQYDTRRAEDAVTAGRMSYDAAAGGRCVATTADAYCLATPFSDPSCSELFTGLVTESGACTSDYECAGGARCEEAVCAVQCCLGTCGAPSTGDPQPPIRAKIGEECQTHTDCVEEAYCEIDRICTAMPDQEGERCLFGCARGDLYCDVDLLECRAYAGLDESCSPNGATAPPCNQAWSYCDGTCRPRPGIGDSCVEVDRTCIPSTYCDETGQCRNRGDVGAECEHSSECVVACDLTAGECVGYEECRVSPVRYTDTSSGTLSERADRRLGQNTMICTN